MKKTADTFYMTQKQQQAFRKKFRGKKKLNFKRFFLLAGVLIVVLVITIIVYHTSFSEGVSDNQKILFMIPGHLLFLLVVVFCIKCIRRDYSILPFLICDFCAILLGFLPVIFDVNEFTLWMTLAVEGPIFVMCVLALISFFRLVGPSLIENLKSTFGRRDDDDEDDF